MHQYTAHPDQALHSPVLERAIEHWELEEGPLPLTLAIELMAEGFDVEKLETEYQT